MGFEKHSISQRYADENSRIAVMKNGDTFRLYDYDLRTVSKELTRTEVNAALREYNTKKNAVTSMNQESTEKNILKIFPRLVLFLFDWLIQFLID